VRTWDCAPGITCDSIRGEPSADGLSAPGITCDPSREELADEDISVHGITGFTGDPIVGDLQTIALLMSACAHQEVSFSGLTHPGKSGLFCLKTKTCSVNDGTGVQWSAEREVLKPSFHGSSGKINWLKFQ
jgi:hypothetical protein